LGATGGFYDTPEISHIKQMALSAFSQIAIYFLEGLTDRAVIPSDPSIPKNIHTRVFLTCNIYLSLFIDIIDDNVMASRIDNSLIVIVE
jgi:hypothetical protein